MLKPDNTTMHILYFLRLKIGYFGLAIITLYGMRQFILKPGIINSSEKRWRFLFIFKTIHYLIIIGYVLLNLHWPLWVWFQLRTQLIPALLMDDLISLFILGGYLLYFLWLSYSIDHYNQLIQTNFRSYLKQYGHIWLLVLNIIIFARIDYFYLPLIPGNLPWFNQILIELLVFVFFVVLQLLVFYLRKLKMTEASPELRALVTEVAARFSVKIKNVRVWQLEWVNNAFSTGIFFHSIFLTESLVNTVNPQDLKMIIGHECAHFKRRHLEVRILMIGLLVFLGSSLIEDFPNLHWSITALYGLFSLILFKGISRIQELRADKLAAKVLDGPERMAEALIRVLGLNSTPNQFGCIIRWLVGHPDLETRIRRLKEEI